MNGVITLILVAALVAVLATALVVYLVMRRRGVAADEATARRDLLASIDAMRADVRASLEGTTQTLNQRIAQLSSEVDRRLTLVGSEVGRRLDSTSGMIGDRLEGAARAVAEVHQKLGTVQGMTERVYEVGKEIASLQEILRAPKLRGGLGELFLGELLSQVLPAQHFELQYVFRGGQRVDAVIKVGERLVPVDAKFPLENFTRIAGAANEELRAQARRAFCADVKRRIDEIAARYILPDEKTLDFALMYVPAENVYYEMIVRDDDAGIALHEYSLTRRVVPVSPNTFYSYLQVILLGLRGLRIEQSAQEILRGLGGLTGDLDRFRQDFQVLGKHLEDAVKKHGDGGRRLQKLQESVERIEMLGESKGETEDGREPAALASGTTPGPGAEILRNDPAIVPG